MQETYDQVPGSGRFPGGGHGYSLQYSCLENHMDRGAWQTTVYSVAKSQTRLKHLSRQTVIIPGTVQAFYLTVSVKQLQFAQTPPVFMEHGPYLLRFEKNLYCRNIYILS